MLHEFGADANRKEGNFNIAVQREFDAKNDFGRATQNGSLGLLIKNSRKTALWRGLHGNGIDVKCQVNALVPASARFLSSVERFQALDGAKSIEICSGADSRRIEPPPGFSARPCQLGDIVSRKRGVAREFLHGAERWIHAIHHASKEKLARLAKVRGRIAKVQKKSVFQA